MNGKDSGLVSILYVICMMPSLITDLVTLYLSHRKQDIRSQYPDYHGEHKMSVETQKK